MPSPIPLDNLERVIQFDPDAFGVFYFGSLGRGAPTRHSDLDIFVAVPDSITEPYQQKLVSLLQLFGEIHYVETLLTLDEQALLAAAGRAAQGAGTTNESGDHVSLRRRRQRW